MDESDVIRANKAISIFVGEIRRPMLNLLQKKIDLKNVNKRNKKSTKSGANKCKRTGKAYKKVLLIGMTSTAGGLERYIMNLFSDLDQKVYTIDFLNQEFPNHIAYEEQIRAQGGNIVSAIKRDKHFFRHYHELMHIFRVKYDVVYYNTLDLTNIDFLILAKILNRNAVKIVHAHNSEMMFKGIRFFLMRVHQQFITKVSDKRYACSKLAGDWMFAGKDYKVINNAIDLDKFCFDPVKKRSMLKQLKLEGKIIWGTVGRLAEQKNPLFLVEIMKYAYERNPNIVFLHIGKGNLWDEMVLKIKAYHLENNYLLLGELKNVEDYYQIMEKFVFPSVFEGFGYAALEAQAMGIQTFITEGDNITREVDVHAGCLTYIPLEKNAQEWAEEIARITAIPDDRRNEYGKYVKKAGFDLKDNHISFDV